VGQIVCWHLTAGLQKIEEILVFRKYFAIISDWLEPSLSIGLSESSPSHVNRSIVEA
jgi:hypothetical protein